MSRIPAQASAVLYQATNTMAAFVIAGDGTMWRSIQSGGDYQWVRVPDLPQPGDEKPLATPGAAR